MNAARTSWGTPDRAERTVYAAQSLDEALAVASEDFARFFNGYTWKIVDVNASADVLIGGSIAGWAVTFTAHRTTTK
jgi:hypothetical protein